MMRTLLPFAVALLLLLRSAPAAAQTPAPPCHPVSPTPLVVIDLQDGKTERGTLLCITGTDAILARDATTLATPLASIRRIRTEADPVWDGFVKGAAIPLIVGAIVCGGDCEAGPLLRAAAAYGAIGATWDSLQGGSRTVYAGSRKRSIAWRVRF